jgi:toxin YhaV
VTPAADPSPLRINGWLVYAHPLFLDQLEGLITSVEKLRHKDPRRYASKNDSKRLAAIARLMLRDIPRDPGGREFQQGSTLGPEHRHWRRAKFFQQYRLFFRFHSGSRVIVLGWVNDDHTRRAYGSKNDAYRVFQAMLASGNPPDDWEDLLRQAGQANQRWHQLTNQLS